MTENEMLQHNPAAVPDGADDQDFEEERTVRVAPEDTGTRVDVWLAGQLGCTRSHVQILLGEGRARKGGKVLKANYKVKAGDVIEVRESSRSSAKFAKLTGPEAPVVALPAWLNRETGSLKGVVAKLPERSDIDYEVAEHLIVELYSK